MEKKIGARLLFSCLNMRKNLRRTMGENRLSSGEWLALRLISEGAGRSLRAALLSDSLDMPRPAISRILNRLEARGYITRETDKTDRRKIAVKITDKGAAQLKEASEKSLKKADFIAEKLGFEDTERLIGLLDRLSDILKESVREKEDGGYE